MVPSLEKNTNDKTVKFFTLEYTVVLTSYASNVPLFQYPMDWPEITETLTDPRLRLCNGNLIHPEALRQ